MCIQCRDDLDIIDIIRENLNNNGINTDDFTDTEIHLGFAEHEDAYLCLDAHGDVIPMWY